MITPSRPGGRRSRNRPDLPRTVRAGAAKHHPDLAAGVMVAEPSVSRVLSWTAISLGTAFLPHSCTRFAGGPMRAASPRFPWIPAFWACSWWGLPSGLTCVIPGGLLPHRFALTSRLAPGGGMFSVALSLSSRHGRRLDLPATMPYGARTFLGHQGLAAEMDAAVRRRGGTVVGDRTGTMGATIPVQGAAMERWMSITEHSLRRQSGRPIVHTCKFQRGFSLSAWFQ